MPTREFLGGKNETFLFADATPEFGTFFPKGVHLLNAGGHEDEGPNGTFVRTIHQRIEFPEALRDLTFRARSSSGEARRSNALVRPTRVLSVAKGTNLNGLWKPGVQVTARAPRAFLKQSLLLRAYDAKGRLIYGGDEPSVAAPDGTLTTTFDVADPKEIARFEWAYREPEFVEFRDVPLRPNP